MFNKTFYQIPRIESGVQGIAQRFDCLRRVGLRDGISQREEDIQVRLQAKDGWAAAQDGLCVVVLSTELTDELIAEGLARELVRTIQDRRKEMKCEFTDRIAVAIVTESKELLAAAEQFRDYICNETLAVELGSEELSGAEAVERKVAGHALSLQVKQVGA